MSLHKKNLQELRKECKQLGLPTSGRKNELVERLMEHMNVVINGNDETTLTQNNFSVIQRVSGLERTIADLQLQFSTPRHPTVMSTNFEHLIPSSPVPAVYTTAANDITSFTSQGIPSQWESAITGHATNAVPNQNIPNNTIYTSVPVTRSNVHNVTQQNIPYAYGHYPPVLHYNNSPYQSHVRDIIELLPIFDPASEKSLNSRQFVKRVELLRDTYGWNESVLLFALQQKCVVQLNCGSTRNNVSLFRGHNS